MITDSLIRKKFVHDTIREGMEKIQEAWRPATRAFGVRTGELRAFADHPRPLTRIGDGRYMMEYDIPLHMRFLDMKYGRRAKGRGARGQGQRNLYNKIVWPVLYRDIFPKLRYGFSEEVQKQIRAQLEKSMNP